MPKKGMKPIRRAQVINSALECLAEGGFENLTLEMVAERAGVSKGVVNYYFKSKQNLLTESFRAFLDYYSEAIASAIKPDMSAMEMLDIIIDISTDPPETNQKRITKEKKKDEKPGLNLNAEQAAKVYILFFVKAILDEEFNSIIQKAYKSYLKDTADLIRFGIKTGEFKSVDPKKAAYAIMAQLDGMTLYDVVGFNPLKKSEAREACRSYIRKYLS